MCHHRGYTPEWRRERTETTADERAEEADDADELPSFLNEEATEDAEVLTDGGEGDAADADD
ncbi:hypothetical protein [Haloarcula nitratireducens]|uniref:Uncharacterized protein n=1 Tax=Haloarcula nitratireducens TaxID=2487749 RepID=A0AAW4PBL5_9EURY|nr:hypothetical protein [Halomicroarcula nitratireducens]MBX0295284.1 hypothetical protein [Halomicroarcula nitratireducens]